MPPTLTRPTLAQLTSRIYELNSRRHDAGSRDELRGLASEAASLVSELEPKVATAQTRYEHVAGRLDAYKAKLQVETPKLVREEFAALARHYKDAHPILSIVHRPDVEVAEQAVEARLDNQVKAELGDDLASAQSSVDAAAGSLDAAKELLARIEYDLTFFRTPEESLRLAH